MSTESIIIPPAVRIAAPLAADFTEEDRAGVWPTEGVRVSTNETHTTVEATNGCMVVRITAPLRKIDPLAAQFPDIEAVIPATKPLARLRIDPRLLRRVCEAAEQAADTVVLELHGPGVIVKAPDVGMLVVRGLYDTMEPSGTFLALIAGMVLEQ